MHTSYSPTIYQCEETSSVSRTMSTARYLLNKYAHWADPEKNPEFPQSKRASSAGWVKMTQAEHDEIYAYLQRGHSAARRPSISGAPRYAVQRSGPEPIEDPNDGSAPRAQ